MPMIRVSEPAYKRLKQLAAEGHRPLVNQLDLLIGNPLQAYDHKPVDMNKITEPYKELFKSDHYAVNDKGGISHYTDLTPAPTEHRKQAEYGTGKPRPKGKKA